MGTTPSILNFFHGIEDKSSYDDIKSNKATLLNLVFPTTALILNAAMKIYSDRLHQLMDRQAAHVFVIIGGKTEVASKQEEKFSFSLGSVIGFPVVVLLTFLTSFATRHLRLLLCFPLQLSLITFVLPCFIIHNNSKIKKLALNKVLIIQETLEFKLRELTRLRSNRVAPNPGKFNSA